MLVKEAEVVSATCLLLYGVHMFLGVCRPLVSSKPNFEKSPKSANPNLEPPKVGAEAAKVGEDCRTS